jgi:hypothetical protein
LVLELFAEVCREAEFAHGADDQGTFPDGIVSIEMLFSSYEELSEIGKEVTSRGQFDKVVMKLLN